MAEPRISESDLFKPIHDYLVNNGYTVRAEVKNCDITATKGEELIIVELKKSFDATLLIQATERQRIADSVYIAIQTPKGPRRGNKWRGILRLLRRLELGLILVHFRIGRPRVEIVQHPAPYRRTKRPQMRRAIIREINGRSDTNNVGGIPAGTKIVTAYRESAIFIACCLESAESMRPKELRQKGTDANTQSILYRNVYGWFERVGSGEYALHPSGKEALEQYPNITSHYREILQKMATREIKSS